MSASSSSVEAFLEQAQIKDSATSTTVGYGFTSDPIRCASYDSFSAAVGFSVKEPWWAIHVDQGR